MGLIMGLSVASTMTVFAGWEQTGATWKYQNTDKTYLTNTWSWIDGNGDGIAECYYFNADGIMAANTTTPDNYTVNENGAWTVNGIVQVKYLNTSDGSDTSSATQPTQTPEYQAPPETKAPSTGGDSMADLFPGWEGGNWEDYDLGGDDGRAGHWH